ncbi:pyridine nucleotide-disulfide oxidoreductase [Wenyingzhuangia fucanilytica]|uniref:Pyridine nucleotide-disulfide oxidoreductase n=1 Tax=Wenyingzhuangia fucanilytica TaxID=1790137 RepID=A0A1B1Y8Y1_9FLAO|nr:FAD-dependent oxidoreductase [Wenyingzhuangia fucanilytica]ANW97225.1 pyridine nucleotide-disulfide oxidoreductase [Wenyingzhuangia fucanilytica]
MSNTKICVVIGASHAGVNFAFSLRKEGWQGDIILFDKDNTTPYHRPPLSKKYLELEDSIQNNFLKPIESYEKENISLALGLGVARVDKENKVLVLEDGTSQNYDVLVFATGARAFVPPIKGINEANNIFTLRNANDVANIRQAFHASQEKKIVVIGGGYIGLETAASLKKLGADVTVLEREERVLARVTTPYLSEFFTKLHQANNVEICVNKGVTEIKTENHQNTVVCSDGSTYKADMVIVGVGIKVNTELASEIGLTINNGIEVDTTAKTSEEGIYAIGDCSYHYNTMYNTYVRLESVQNAVDQAKVAAANICEKPTVYNAIPWFWSDQYDVKLQIVGLSQGFDNTVVRKEEDKKFSIWYFKGEQLLAVDAVNNAKAYVFATKYIKTKTIIDKDKLVNPEIDLKSIVVN